MEENVDALTGELGSLIMEYERLQDGVGEAWKPVLDRMIAVEQKIKRLRAPSQPHGVRSE